MPTTDIGRDELLRDDIDDLVEEAAKYGEQVDIATCTILGLDPQTRNLQDYQKMDLHQARMEKSRWRHLDCSNSSLEKVYADEARFTWGTKLNGATMEQGSFVRATFDDVEACRSIGKDADFSECYMRYTKLHGAQWQRAKIERAQLFGVQAPEINLDGAQICESIIEELIAPNASLRQANFAFSRITGSSFKYADLSEANLGGAILTDVLLTGATLTGTRLRGVQLDEKTMLETSDINVIKSCLFSLLTQVERRDVRPARIEQYYLALGKSVARVPDLFETLGIHRPEDSSAMMEQPEMRSRLIVARFIDGMLPVGTFDPLFDPGPVRRIVLGWIADWMEQRDYPVPVVEEDTNP